MSLEKLLKYPVMGPLLGLLRSRKFWVALATLVVNMLVAQDPRFADIQEVLIATISGLGVMLIHAIAKEDAAKAQAAAPLG
jgi:hypothetical protein